MDWTINPTEVMQNLYLFQQLLGMRQQNQARQVMGQVLPKILSGTATDEDYKRLYAINPDMALKIPELQSTLEKQKQVNTLLQGLGIFNNNQQLPQTTAIPISPTTTQSPADIFTNKAMDLLPAIKPQTSTQVNEEQLFPTTQQNILKQALGLYPNLKTPTFSEADQKKLFALGLLGEKGGLDVLKTSYDLQGKQAEILKTLVDTHKIINEVAQGNLQFPELLKKLQLDNQKISTEIERIKQEIENAKTEGDIKKADLLSKNLDNFWKPLQNSVELANKYLEGAKTQAGIGETQATTEKIKQETQQKQELFPLVKQEKQANIQETLARTKEIGARTSNIGTPEARKLTAQEQKSLMSFIQTVDAVKRYKDWVSNLTPVDRIKSAFTPAPDWMNTAKTIYQDYPLNTQDDYIRLAQRFGLNTYDPVIRKEIENIMYGGTILPQQQTLQPQTQQPQAPQQQTTQRYKIISIK